MPIDFQALARDLLARSRELLPAWLPAGRFRGREFVVGSLQGEQGDSLSINWTEGPWKDFAAGQAGGDLLSLFAAINNVSQSEAARLLGDVASTPVPQNAVREKKTQRRVVAPAPKSAGIPPCVHYKYREATAVYIYRDAAGLTLGAVARYDPPEMRKQVIPWTWQVENGRGSWRMGSWDRPRPLYGLDDLARRPKAPVLLVEGEKCADAARLLMPQYVCMTWVGGGGNHDYIDFTPLKGRNVLLWPDADNPGVSAMWSVGFKLLRSLCPAVKIIIPGPELPDGWDVADAIQQEGFNDPDPSTRWQFFKAWVAPLVKELKEEFRNDEQEGSTVTGTDSGGAAKHAAAGRDAPVHDVQRDGNSGDDEQWASAGSRSENGAAGNEMASAGLPAGTDGSARGAKRNRAKGSRDGGGSKSSVDLAHDVGERVDTGRDRAVASHKEAPPSEVRQRKEVYWSRWGFDLSANGTPLQNLSNAVATLEHDPDWQGKIWYDVFLQRIIADIPGKDGPREWSDFDDINLTLYMQRVIGLSKISSEIVAKAVVQIARSNLKHCVRDWLDALKWDGVERIEHFFEDHFGAAANVYTRAVSRNLWMSIVARTYLPGCKQDYMVVLEGPQGNGKSSAIEAIASRPWFAVASESVLSKDFFAALQGKLVIEISELDAFDRADATRVKMVLSTSEDRFRAPYDRHSEDHPRQNIFIASTNRYDSNKDDTGARRNWYIRCQGAIDVPAIRANREQLFAEAVARFKRVPLDCPLAGRVVVGADWWNIPTEEAEEEQQRRFQEDSWAAHVADYLGLRDEVRIGEILTEGLKIEIGKVKRTDELRAASVLRSLGWEKTDARRDGKVVKIWQRKPGSGF